MPCTGRYAEAWEYTALFCPGTILSGQDRLAGPAHADLTDSQADFVHGSIQANVGMVLYNLTTGLSGVVTAVTANTLTATGVTWTIGNLYRIAPLTGTEISAINMALDITASDLHSALAASGACSCTFASWADQYLTKLNIIDAAVFRNCTCGSSNLDPDTRKSYLDWVNGQLELIRTGKLELCEGETGSEFPAAAWAEQSATEFAASEIIVSRG